MPLCTGTHQVLARVYMARSDVGYTVRTAAVHVWKTVVSNTPRTLGEILPALMEQVIDALASAGERAGLGLTTLPPFWPHSPACVFRMQQWRQCMQAIGNPVDARPKQRIADRLFAPPTPKSAALVASGSFASPA